MNKTDFMRWFNSGFWKAFTNSTFPIVLPKTFAEKLQLLDSVFDEIESARYAPGIPEAELVMNKGTRRGKYYPRVQHAGLLRLLLLHQGIGSRALRKSYTKHFWWLVAGREFAQAGA